MHKLNNHIIVAIKVKVDLHCQLTIDKKPVYHFFFKSTLEHLHSIFIKKIFRYFIYRKIKYVYIYF